MIECEVKLSPDQRGEFLSALNNQSSDMRPHQYSIDEDGPRSQLSLSESDLQNVDCFLWAPECGYEITFDTSGSITIFAFSENVSGMQKLISSLSELLVIFGYACDSEERVHRNRVSQPMPYGIHEAWVGRDFTRYLPGLYWMTLIPSSMVSRFGLTLDSIREASLSVDVIGNTNLLVRLYDRPGDWRAAMGLIDDWCMKRDGCFSKKSLAGPLSEVSDFIGMSNLLESFP